jgi:carboxyl-terminal processing protease
MYATQHSSMQVIPLDEDDGSAVVVTVAKYQTPSGRDINRVGIKPDINVPSQGVPVEHVCAALAAPDAPRLFK